MSWHVYLVRCANNALYCGITVDVKRRVDQHNGLTKGGAKFTRSHRPVVVVWSKEVESRSEAARQEARIKRMTKAEKELFHTWG